MSVRGPASCTAPQRALHRTLYPAALRPPSLLSRSCRPRVHPCVFTHGTAHVTPTLPRHTSPHRRSTAGRAWPPSTRQSVPCSSLLSAPAAPSHGPCGTHEATPSDGRAPTSPVHQRHSLCFSFVAHNGHPIPNTPPPSPAHPRHIQTQNKTKNRPKETHPNLTYALVRTSTRYGERTGSQGTTRPCGVPISFRIPPASFR
jgi:hypothetical protein